MQQVKPNRWLAVRHLAKNVIAGARLALFLRVRLLDFRVSALQYAALVLMSLASWLVGGLVREGLPGTIDVDALLAALAQVPLLLVASLLAARILGNPGLLVALAVLLTAADPLFEIAGTAVRLLFQDERLAAYGGIANLLFIGWGYAVIVRAQVLLSGWHFPRSAFAAGLFAAMMAIFVWGIPRTELWTALDPEPEATGQVSVAREDLFHLQGELLERRLNEMEPERPSVEDLYFVGVASFGLQDTFAREVSVVRRLMDERFDTEGRSIMLVNHPSTLAEQPIATVSNLSSTLGNLSRIMNPEEDLLFLLLSSHGMSDHQLAFAMPPLELQQLSPIALARMLNDAGFKWKVIVVSACFSGGFVEPLRDDNTLIITAADESHQSFGCEFGSDMTWFSKAYFDEALRTTFSFTEAFEKAANSVAERERVEGYVPSSPQIYLGSAMRAKLASLQQRLEERGTRNAVQARR